ncbi:MAG: winged helix-turn-helix transcriptional regulator [Candidatus Marinimicrobia bacterium]|nr:winged helix-turn-helix transcriptional regulator [Candidatus Neomarinimicrobiota bacterium]MBL7023704.1 winged helix-turn-helix transcriptional regulator [Candidatus Neomarinimicrobiota bacterium]MBL7110010.1 winged helix-turn-helix transcriptional regulator [Candidatus Neomarinimicrobiota bacterium]
MEKQIDINKVITASRTLKVLAHPIRIKIVEYLEEGEKNVGAIQDYIGLEQAVTSQHLKLMFTKGLLKRRREGNFIYYSIHNEILEGILHCIRDCKNP